MQNTRRAQRSGVAAKRVEIDGPADAAAVAAMETRAAAVRAGEAGELVWLLEHPALYTAGTSARPDDLLARYGRDDLEDVFLDIARQRRHLEQPQLRRLGQALHLPVEALRPLVIALATTLAILPTPARAAPRTARPAATPSAAARAGPTDAPSRRGSHRSGATAPPAPRR